MHHNYYFLKQLAPRLDQMMRGKVFLEAFSQEKDEIVLIFGNGDEAAFIIKAVLRSDFSCLSFPEKFDRARKNSVNLFNMLCGATIAQVRVYENERAIGICFEDNRKLIMKLFGNRSNLIAFSGEDEVIQLFNNRLATDRNLHTGQLDRHIDQTFAAFQNNGGSFQQLFPTLGKLANAELSARLRDIDTVETQWRIITAFVSELEKPPYYLTQVEGMPILALFETGDVSALFSDPIEALNAFYLAHMRLSGLEKEKADIVRIIKKRIQQTANYLENTFEKLIALESAVKNDELGNIIMANLHQIPERAEKVELYDFYREKPIVIKLKKDLSAQKNAETFYRKSKNEKIEIGRLNDSLLAREVEKKNLEAHLVQIESIESLRELRLYIKTNQLNQGKTAVEVADLFKKVEFMGYTILIGRNAKNNDVLTKQFATKEDIWLHARDVTGSHVVIKNQPGKKVPALVIERAAELAAFFSKRKNDSLCPVIYTPKKYVRKPKGLPDGAVVIDKENVILVVAKGE